MLERFTRDDQELELERYQQAAERQQLTARQGEARVALAKLGVAATPEAQSAWSRCDGPAHMAVKALPRP